MSRKTLNLTIFALVLLLLLPLVALGLRIADGFTDVFCLPAAEAELMRGGDEPGRPRLFLLPGETLDINSASAEELKALPGIDDVLAERIVEQRSTGDYESKEDIMKVEGIGEGRYDRIKELIRTGGTP